MTGYWGGSLYCEDVTMDLVDILIIKESARKWPSMFRIREASAALAVNANISR
jgi:hypothetical protein